MSPISPVGHGRESLVSRAVRLLAALTALTLLSGCGVQTALMDTTPKSDGSLTVASTASQAFYAPSDGLDRISIGLVAETAGTETYPQLAAGATFTIAPAPDADVSFPDGDFTNWPSDQLWLPELTGDQVIGQSFISRYAGLNGITLRVATFGGDAGNGPATLKAGPPLTLLDYPIVGKSVGQVAGGSQVQVAGTAEGWARVVVPSGPTGYLPLSDFATLPPPSRVNDRDVTLRLYREGETTPVRQATINARDIHDNSHVTFKFEPLGDAPGGRYRFTVSSPDSVPGNAVAFRYAPTDIYGDGTRYQGDAPVAGDLIFRPTYGPQPVLVRGKLDDFVWSAQTQTIDGSFKPLADTAGRFFRVTLQAGDRPLALTWSQNRPLGERPVEVQGDSSAPDGARVFNAGFQDPIHPGALASGAFHTAAHDVERDWGFFVLYGVLLLLVVGGFGGMLLRAPRGR